MLVSWKWLSHFANIPLPIKDFADRLTVTGSEVEEIREPWKELCGVITAKVAGITEHPEKSSLKIIRLTAKEKEFSCVTAAKNIALGQVVPYGPPGASLPKGDVLGIRFFGSMESQGMLLSASELALDGLGEEGILILPAETPEGADFKTFFALDDHVLDISITPNRGDLLSLYGMAREAQGICPTSSTKPDQQCDEGMEKWPFVMELAKSDEKLCPFFSLGLLTDVTVTSSPVDAQITLVKHGIRPINNIVDATNLAMLALGQPLHGYDGDLLGVKKLSVFPAREGDTLVTLDGKERTLTSSDLCIYDGGNPVGLAGVMGGQDTEIGDQTRTVILESATFNSPMVGATSRRFGITSEASYRNARGVNREKALLGLKYCMDLLQSWSAGRGGYEILSTGNSSTPSREITLTADKLKRILLHENMDEAHRILERLGFEEISQTSQSRTYRVPQERLDISIEEDLVEEVGRIEGYGHIPSRIPSSLHQRGNTTVAMSQVRRLREIAMARGYTEVVSYSFIAPGAMKDLDVPEKDERSRCISVLNPISKELSCMRTFLLPGLLQGVVKNVRAGWKDSIRVFEAGRVFLCSGEKGHNEPSFIGGVVFVGKRTKPLEFQDDFFTVKGDVLALCKGNGASVSFRQAEEPFGHRGQTAHVYKGESKIGYLARLKPSLEEFFDLGAPTYAFEINTDIIMEPEQQTFGETTRYPGIYRDISLLVNMKTPSAGDIIQKITSLLGENAESVTLFDEYKGKGVPQGKRSLSFSVLYKNKERTLSDQEVEEEHTALRHALESSGYILR